MLIFVVKLALLFFIGGFGLPAPVNAQSWQEVSSHLFTKTDGKWPVAGVMLSGSTLYGTALEGGSSGYGTVFSLTLPSPPPLTIVHSATNIILSWPTNAAGLTFTLQSTTNFISGGGWGNVSPSAVIVNGRNTVTNLISSSQKFYRLSQ